MVAARLINKWFFWVWKPLLLRHLLERRKVYWRWRKRVLTTEARLIDWFIRGRYRAAGTALASRFAFVMAKSVAGAVLVAMLIIAATCTLEHVLKGRGLWFPQAWSNAVALQREAYTSVLAT